MTRAHSFRKAVAVCAVLAAGAPGCRTSPTNPTAAPVFSQLDVQLGNGTVAALGNMLTVNYTGWLYDPSRADKKGLQFDTSVGKTAFTFTLGAGQVIAGWDQGVPGMKVGGIRQLVIPPARAYGATRSGPIPPNATLVFDIELIDVK